MATFAIGMVALVRFPFSDLSQTKRRPAVILADTGQNDYVLCQITSNRYADLQAIELRDEHFDQGSLHRTSYARPGKLFTANHTLIVQEVGTLKPEVRLRIVEKIERLLRKGIH